VTARVAACVLARDRPEETAATLDALLAQEPSTNRLLLIDNDSTPEVLEVLVGAAARHPDAEILRLPANRGCAGGFEAGLQLLLQRDDVDFIVGFDDDARPLPGCLAALIAAAHRLPDAAAVGALSHDASGTLAWPMLVVGERTPMRTVDAVAARGRPLAVHSLAWHGLMFRVDVLRRAGIVWGDLFLQYEDIELGMRYRRAGFQCYLVPEAECLHPAPPPSRTLTLFGRSIDITAQTAAKEYLTLRNGLAVRRRHDGLRFWYGTAPLVIVRGLLSAIALDVPVLQALRHVFVRGVTDAARGRLGPPPPATVQTGASEQSKEFP
jgi:GT2 family glycosyltransferase